MSGYVVLLNLDGKPVSPALLLEMTESMAFRGPDEQHTHIAGSVGMGHALLRTTCESKFERQPLTLDNNVWIVADGRIDGRSDILARFSSGERFQLSDAPDVELILRAYLNWGEDCLDYLIGDFSFAIWDGKDNKLFCARDHFGIKPLYYARTTNSLIVSNTINCIRLHSEISDDLNDQAVGDYLLWGSNEYPESTYYIDINRVPAAHKLILSGKHLTITKYWTLPIQDELRYKRQSDYVEHFTELLNSAVEDRLRTDQVAIFLSGGMDSSTIATTARDILVNKNSSVKFEAFTAVFERLIPDRERYYSGLVAEKLGIPIHYLVADDLKLFEGWDSPELKRPMPSYEASSIIGLLQYRQIASEFRVALTGQGGDVILRPSFSYFINQFRHFQFGQTFKQLINQAIESKRLPRIGLRTWLRNKLKQNPWLSYYPLWLNKDFETKFDLKSRWMELTSEKPPGHPYRPEAYKLFNSVFWTNLFEGFDPGNNNFQFEQRHPLFDTRLVGYAMRLPSLPWCVDKRLMRESMRGRLPEEILRRAKAPVPGDPQAEQRKRGDAIPSHYLNPSPLVFKYVDWDCLRLQLQSGVSPDQQTASYYPLSFNCWIKR